MVFLVRAGNLLILALVIYLTSYFLLNIPNPFWSHLPLHYIVLSVLCSAAAGYIINDYYDVKIDSINRPNRVVIDRKIHRRNALIWNGILDVSAMVFACLVSYYMAIIVGFCIFLLWSYSNHFKRLPLIGNLIIATLSGISILLVPYHFREVNEAVLVYALFSFLITLIREIVKDMEDMKGDVRFNCKTLPIVLGIRRTRYVLYLLVISLIVLIGNFLYLGGGYSNCLLYVVILGLLYFAFAISKADTTSAFDQLSSFCKVLMLVGLMSVLI